MQIDTGQWTDEIDLITEDFNQAFGHLTPSDLNWKPAPAIWSIAQNIDHLIVLNESYFPILAQLREGTYAIPFWARFDLIPGILGNLLLKSVQPGQKRKTKTLAQWKPTEHSNFDQILEKFEEHQEKLKAEIDRSKELLEKKAVISSPGHMNIVYRLDKAFDIMVAHEKRHFEQAKDILNRLEQKK